MCNNVSSAGILPQSVPSAYHHNSPRWCRMPSLTKYQAFLNPAISAPSFVVGIASEVIHYSFEIFTYPSGMKVFQSNSSIYITELLLVFLNESHTM